ncbi:MAG: pseudouridine synthase [Anaerolineaceae bacterium]
MKIKSRYLKFNKPYGVLSSFSDPEGRPTLSDYIPVKEVYAAGRLDFDSEGLMILTNDGNLVHHLIEPRFHLPKTYFVQVEGEIAPAALHALESGVEIKGGYKTQRCKVLPINEPGIGERSKPITPHGPTNWLRIEITEGKKRQIRHMTAAVGLPTLRIFRVAIGDVTVTGLEPGAWRDLTPQEIEKLWRK